MSDHSEPYDSAKLFGDSAVKRLGHVHTLLDQIKRHANDSADVQAADLAQSMIEAAQEDIHDVQDAVREHSEEVSEE